MNPRRKSAKERSPKSSPYRIHVYLKTDDREEIEKILELDPDARRSSLIREAVLAYKPEYKRRIAYLEQRKLQRR